MNAQDLKNSILQLAVQGKLVEQRPEEGTAKELLAQIKAEKEQLIKEKKIKKTKPLPEITEDEIPFEIPSSWKWIRLAELGEIVGGGTPKTINSEFWDGDIAWITPADMKNVQGKYVSRGARNITQTGLEKSSARLMPAGSVLYSSRAPIGYIAIAENDISTNQGFKSLVPTDTAISEYIYYCLIARTNNIISRASGTTFKEISGSEFGMTVIPIPPLAEQKRIVAKIEEILPYIEQYDKAYTKLERFNKKFPEDMKKSILQLAMQGKLVEQRAEEGTTDELYEQIVAEKARLMKEGKIKKEKPLPEIAEDEIPFEIPDSWKWVRLGDLAIFYGGYAYKSNRYVQNSANQVVRLGNVKNDKIVLSTNPVYVDEEYALETEKYKVLSGDILFTMTGTRGKRDYFYTALVSENDLSNFILYLNQRVGCLRCLSEIDRHWLCMILKSEVILKQVFENETGTANQGNIGSDRTMSILVPLPPLAEQKRIVAKIEEILPYCDQLMK